MSASQEDTRRCPITRLTGTSESVDAGIATLPRQRLDDRDSGSAMAITPWEDEQALAASDERANQVRSDVANEMQASSPRPLSAMG